MLADYQDGIALTASAVLAVADLAALIFVSADEGLLAAAVAEGMTVENPNRH